MILVTGATGRVGGALVGLLKRQGAAVRCLVRDPARARSILGDEIELAKGDLDDPASLSVALAGVKAMFLMSPVAADLARLQVGAVRAAVAAGVKRLVKLSGSAWTLGDSPTVTGALHMEVEAALAATDLESVCLRPNAFAQTSLARLPAELAQGDTFSLAWGVGRVPLIDLRDIAAVAGHALAAVQPRPVIELSGSTDLGGAELAVLASRLTGRAIRYRPIAPEQALAAARGRGESAFVIEHLRQVFERIGQGLAAGPAEGVAGTLGRPPRPVEEWLGEALQPR
ncbi:MAG: NmrA family NAD(P)-binding protein [Burkholderiales bacterium]